MKLKRILAMFCIATLLLSGCATASSSKTDAEPIARTPAAKEAPQNIHQLALQDKPLLYANKDPLSVKTLYLTVRKGNEGENTAHTWQEINTYSVYDYDKMKTDRYKVEAILQEGDETGPVPGALGYGLTTPNATVQVRGQTSSEYPQKNYKIRLKKDTELLDGQRTIALNKHMGDSLRIRNKMMFDLMTEIPAMMSLRTQFVHLYVKDETAGGTAAFADYGLYTQVEQLNTTALMAHGCDRNGQLYKINSCEFYPYEEDIKLKTDPTYNLKAFEKRLEVKGNDDHTKLIAMLHDVNDYSKPIAEIVDTYFDIDNLLTWMAFHILTGNEDTQNRNMYIYSPLNSEKWYVWSWDNDGALNQKTRELQGKTLDRGWERGISNYWGNILFRRVLKSADYRAMLDERIETLYHGVLAPAKVQAMAEQYAAVTTPYLYVMPDIQHAPVTQAEHDVVLANVKTEIENNYKEYQESLTRPMPFYIDVPRQTETGYACDWDASFDLNSSDITYTAEISNSIDFTNPIAEYTGELPEITMPKLASGQYFIHVAAQNAEGKQQDAFDYYVTEDNNKIFGVRCFYVLEDGTVEMSTYEE
ncbi:MAG: CotH kinase family protein [Ruthenibacterium sp.]